MNDIVAQTLELVSQKLLATGYIFHDTDAKTWPNCSSLLCKDDAEIIVTPLPDVLGEIHTNTLTHFTSRHSGVIMVGTLAADSPEINRLFSTLRGRYVYINPIEKTYRRHVSWGILTPAPKALDESWCSDYANDIISQAEAAIDVKAELCKHMASHAETSAFLEKVNMATGFRRPHVTWTMIGIFAAIYAAMVLIYHTTEFTNAQLLKWGADQGRLIVSGEYWRIITSGFLHANFMHIFFNCLGCYYFGSVVEQYQGRARLVGVFVFSVIVGNLAGLWFHPQSVAVGASGGLFGLIGMIAAMTIRYYRQMPHMVRTALKRWIISILGFNVLFMAMPQVDIAAHVGGLAGGLIIGLIVARPMGSKARPSLFTIALTIILLFFTADLGMKVINALSEKLKPAAQTQPQLLLELTPQELLSLQQNAAGKILVRPVPGKPGNFYIVGLHPELAPSSQPQK